MLKTNWEYLKLDHRGRVLTVTFNSGNKVNSLNTALMRELTQLAQQLQDDSELNAVILAGQKTIFSGGMDLKDPELTRAKQLLILAEPLDATTGEKWGLVDYLTPTGESLNKAKELAEKLTDIPPIPLRMAKKAINVSANALNDATSFMDADQFMLTQGSEDALEGAMAFFEKRPPHFKGN